MKILIDNGHGEETPGKRSPDGLFREYKYARQIAEEVVKQLQAKGYDAQRIVTEDNDVSLAERCKRVNAICDKVGAGITLGEVKGKDLIPDQSLALSCHLNREAFSCCEINWEEAIRYLRKEALVLPPDLPKGYVLLTYKGAPLGFVKHLGNRANNLYPQEWRIRSGYLPDEVRLL
jgi:NOL1/NOP2/fmu family ribosome biogenesis protein